MRQDAPPESRRTPGKRVAIALAVAVHLLLAAFLFYGVAWQTKPSDVVEVDLVANTPAAAPAKAETPPPETKPEPKPEPRVEPKTEPRPAPAKPDIVVKDKPKPPEPKPPEAKRLSFLDSLNEEFKALTNRKAADAAQQQKAAQDAAQAQSARSKAVAGYVDRIRSKIRGNTAAPPDLQGNPVAKFDVVQLPSGEIISARLVKPSGNKAYDDAVERAILKSSPLPKPDEPGLFQRELRLTFCPQESGCN